MSKGNVLVTAFVKTRTGSKFGGAIFAETNCWSMLKGGFTAEESGPAELYFEVQFFSSNFITIYLEFDFKKLT